MNRASFLRRTVGAVVGLAVAPRALAAPEVLSSAPPLPWSLNGADPLQDIRDWAARAKSQPLVAPGGLCAPISPYYAIVVAETARPIADALPPFRADRGGIRYRSPGKDTPA